MLDIIYVIQKFWLHECLLLLLILIIRTLMVYGSVYLMFNATLNEISVKHVYVTALRSAGGLTKKSVGLQRHRLKFIGFLNVPVHAAAGGRQPFTVITGNPNWLIFHYTMVITWQRPFIRYKQWHNASYRIANRSEQKVDIVSFLNVNVSRIIYKILTNN